MKSDRRTLVVAIVFLCFLIFSTQLRGQFLYGARLTVPGELTPDNWTMGSTDVLGNTFSISAWSLKHLPEQSESTRNGKLGLVLVKVLHGYNSLDHMKPLEDYCAANPEDLKARAHLLRMSLNSSGLKSDELQKYRPFAARLVALAADAAKKEPDNWYWRERQFHFLVLLGNDEEATTNLAATPFPKSYDDYVVDEIECKEEVYRTGFYDLPKSAMLEVWGGTLFPHLTARTQIENLIKSGSDKVMLRVAEIDLGRAMTKATPTAIAAMVGVGNINHGIWGTKSSAPGKVEMKDLKVQAEVEGPYQKAVSKDAWEYCLRASKNSIRPNFLQPKEQLASLYVGHVGPLFIFAGIIGVIVGLIQFRAFRLKRKWLRSEYVCWSMIFIAIKSLAWTWSDWSGLGNYTLGCNLLAPLLFVLSGICLFWCIRREKTKRLIPSIFVLVTVVSGMFFQPWQASSIIILILFAMQRGVAPLKPWTTALGVFLISYHAAANAAFTNGVNENMIWLCLGIGALLMVSKMEFEPDEPRFATVTIGVGSLIFGTILMAQYDKAIQASMENDLKQTEVVRNKFAKL